MQIFKELQHSVQMAAKNIKSYLFLSMTVLLSFCFMLFYLIYADSETFNKYEESLSLDPEISTLQIVSLNGDGTYNATGTFENMQSGALKVRSYLSHIKDCRTAITYFSNDSFTLRDKCTLSLSFVEDHGFAFFILGYGSILSYVEPLENALQDGEALVNRSFYDWIRESTGEEEPTVSFDYVYADNTRTRLEVKIVGATTYDNEYGAPTVDEDGNLTGKVKMILPTSTLVRLSESGTPANLYAYMVAYAPAEYQESIYEYAKDSDVVRGYGSYNVIAINAARQSVQEAIEQRALLLCFFYVVLAVNLYGSFRNALNDRKFEIGVKRAIGASKKSIIRQFLTEGLLVVVGNMLLSIYLVLTGFLIYKTILYHAQGVVWTIYLGWSALAGFLIVCLSLALLFSFIFAWQTSKVNVIDNLRAE